MEEPSSAHQKCPQICKTPSHHLKQLILGLPVTYCPLQFPCLALCMLEAGGCTSCTPWVITALQHSAVSPGHRPTAPNSPTSRQPPGTQLGLSCFKGQVVMKMSCNCIRREDWQRSPGLQQAAPLHPLPQRLPVPKQVVSWPRCCC